MAKSKSKKEHCDGNWTTARKNSFIISALRRASCRWSPKHTTKKEARVARNTYVCSMCKKKVGNKDIKVDHIDQVVGPNGFVDWNTFIERLFVEKDKLRCVCTFCHDIITQKQKDLRKSIKACEEAGQQLELNYTEQNVRIEKRSRNISAPGGQETFP